MQNAIGMATTKAMSVLAIACQVVNKTTFRICEVRSSFIESSFIEVKKIFSVGTTTNNAMNTIGKTASKSRARLLL